MGVNEYKVCTGGGPLKPLALRARGGETAGRGLGMLGQEAPRTGDSAYRTRTIHDPHDFA